MYQLLLTRVYLTSKIMPLLASLGLGLCTAMVLVIWSVMGGFLTTLLASGRTFAGDVTINWPAGIPHYEALTKLLEADPSVAGVAPIIDTFGVVKLPDDRIEGVRIVGIEGSSYAKVVEFDKAIWWRPMTEALRKDRDAKDPRLDPNAQDWESIYFDSLSLTKMDPVTQERIPAAVVGIELSGMTERDVAGYYTARGLAKPRSDGSVINLPLYLHNNQIVLNMIPQDNQGRLLTPTSKPLPVAGEFRTGIFEIDRRTIFVQLAELQRLMQMEGAPNVKGTGESFNPYANLSPEGKSLGTVATSGEAPARVSTLVVRAADGYTPDQCREACIRVYREFERSFEGRVPRPFQLENGKSIKTWQMQMATLISAVEKETALVLALFWLVTFVCSGLILAIFWAMISEKTKDIGILRAIGASRSGIAAMWIVYGALLGVVGVVFGLVLAIAVVTNINAIHDWLGYALNLYIWDPRVYYFSKIPDRVDPRSAAIVAGAGIGFAVLGSIIPAVRAAWIRPVTALRFE